MNKFLKILLDIIFWIWAMIPIFATIGSLYYLYFICSFGLLPTSVISLIVGFLFLVINGGIADFFFDE